MRRACGERKLSVNVNYNDEPPTGSAFMVKEWRSFRSRRRWLSGRGTRRGGDNRQCRLVHGVTVGCHNNGSPDSSKSFNTCIWILCLLHVSPCQLSLKDCGVAERPRIIDRKYFCFVPTRSKEAANVVCRRSCPCYSTGDLGGQRTLRQVIAGNDR